MNDRKNIASVYQVREKLNLKMKLQLANLEVWAAARQTSYLIVLWTPSFKTSEVIQIFPKFLEISYVYKKIHVNHESE